MALPALPDPDQFDLPSFKVLTDKQRRFVWALIKWGSGRGMRTKCAREAGYIGDNDTLSVTASRAFHDPKVQQALHDVAAAHLGSYQLFAIEQLGVLAETADKHETRLKAALAIADRTGFGAVQQINVTKEDTNVTREQRLAEMTAMCARNPKLLDQLAPPVRALIETRLQVKPGDTASPVQTAPVLEGEFKDVTPRMGEQPADPDDELLKV